MRYVEPGLEARVVQQTCSLRHVQTHLQYNPMYYV